MAPEPYVFPTAREVRRLLNTEGLSPQKRWGQNFLIDEGYATRIVDLAAPEPARRADPDGAAAANGASTANGAAALRGASAADGATDPPPGLHIWEIGPGVGALTGILLNRGCRVVAFEIDWGLTRVLSRRFIEEPRLRVRQGDAVREWEKEHEEGPAPDAVIGNLPYRSASAIIGSFLEHRFVPPVQVFTVQREVADRMIAAPGSRTYSAFSVLVQTISTPRRAFDVPPGAFFPAPEVNSSVVVLTPRSSADTTAAPALDEWALFLRLLRELFRSRRKMIRKAVGEFVGNEGCRRSGEEILAECGLRPDMRAEALEPEDFLRLARAIHRDVTGPAG